MNNKKLILVSLSLNSHQLDWNLIDWLWNYTENLLKDGEKTSTILQYFMAFPSISLNSTFFMQARPYRDNQPIHDHISTNSLIKNVSGGFDM